MGGEQEATAGTTASPEHTVAPIPESEKKLRELQRRAESGDAAILELGDAYRDGQFVAKDVLQSVVWYRKGASAGNTAAMGRLGALYAMGFGVPQSNTEAGVWYRKAAEAGDADAMFELAYRYEFGQGVAMDDDEAKRWYLESGRLGREDVGASLERLVKKEAAEQRRRDEEERQARTAADSARLEEERKTAAAEKARQDHAERERKAAQEKARQEELERQRIAIEKARLEEQRQQAAENARLAQQERDRKIAEEKLQREEMERQRLAAAPAQRKDEPQDAAASPALTIFPGGLKTIAFAVCGVAVVAILIYWAIPSKPPQDSTQTTAVNTGTSPASAPSQNPSSNADAQKDTVAKPAGSKLAASEVTGRKPTAGNTVQNPWGSADQSISFSLLGKNVKSAEIQDWLSKVAVSPQIQKFDSGAFYNFKPLGISLEFDKSHVLTQIFLYSEGADGFRQYPGPLPSGLSFLISRKEIDSMFGKPSFGSETNCVINCWEAWEQKGLNVQYNTTRGDDQNARI